MSTLQEKFNNAVQLHNMGMINEAKSEYLKLLELIDNADIYCLIALTCFDLKQYNEAIGYALKGVEIEPRKDLYEIVASSYELMSDTVQAVTYYSKILEIEPADEKTLLTLAKLYYNNGLIYDAASTYKKLTLIKPEYEKKYKPIGNILTSLV